MEETRRHLANLITNEMVPGLQENRKVAFVVVLISSIDMYI